jgi:hypothetical protein
MVQTRTCFFDRVIHFGEHHRRNHSMASGAPRAAAEITAVAGKKTAKKTSVAVSAIAATAVEAVLAKRRSLLPKVVNVKKASLNAIGYSDFLSWSSQPGHVYIGRNMNFYVKGALGSPWANPYTLKKYSRTECLSKYEAYVREGPLWNRLDELKNATQLGCWCSPDGCHGDVLARLIHERFGPAKPRQSAVDGSVARRCAATVEEPPVAK